MLYQKRPAKIEAVQFNGNPYELPPEFAKAITLRNGRYIIDYGFDFETIVVGDYLVKPNIGPVIHMTKGYFEQEYEPAE